VWLAPRSAWRARYAGWPALRKLEYVDGLLRQIQDRPPPVRTCERMDPVGSLRMTLREYYRRRRARIGRRRGSREYHR
jgi:hypothetical protein